MVTAHLRRAAKKAVKESKEYSVDSLRQYGPDLARLALQLAAEAKSRKEICQDIGISSQALQQMCRELPGFRDALETAMSDASQLVLEQIKELPWIEPDIQLARLKIDALTRYLELRWPQQYGKRINLAVTTMDLTGALADARKRAGLIIEQRVLPIEDDAFTII